MRILVIDDDSSVGAVIAALLSRDRCEVVAVQSGPLGIRALAQSYFDLVMVDLFMPGMDGMEALKKCRQAWPALPSIAMSGLRFRPLSVPTPDYLEMAVKLGATRCLRKPFQRQQLVDAVTGCFDSDHPEFSCAAKNRSEEIDAAGRNKHRSDASLCH